MWHVPDSTQGNFAAVLHAYNTPGRDVLWDCQRTGYRFIEKYSKAFAEPKKNGIKKWTTY